QALARVPLLPLGSRYAAAFLLSAVSGVAELAQRAGHPAAGLFLSRSFFVSHSREARANSALFISFRGVHPALRTTNSSCTCTARARTRLFLSISLTQAYSMPRSSLLLTRVSLSQKLLTVCRRRWWNLSSDAGKPRVPHGKLASRDRSLSRALPRKVGRWLVRWRPSRSVFFSAFLLLFVRWWLDRGGSPASTSSLLTLVARMHLGKAVRLPQALPVQIAPLRSLPSLLFRPQQSRALIGGLDRTISL
ncbi:hypothetical protein TSAR_013769, partial [Trichomalopsis sarcophagae]